MVALVDVSGDEPYLETVRSALLAALLAAGPAALFGLATLSHRVGLWDLQGDVPAVRHVPLAAHAGAGAACALELADALPLHAFLAPVDRWRDEIEAGLEAMSPISAEERADAAAQCARRAGAGGQQVRSQAQLASPARRLTRAPAAGWGGRTCAWAGAGCAADIPGRAWRERLGAGTPRGECGRRLGRGWRRALPQRAHPHIPGWAARCGRGRVGRRTLGGRGADAVPARSCSTERCDAGGCAGCGRCARCAADGLLRRGRRACRGAGRATPCTLVACEFLTRANAMQAGGIIVDLFALPPAGDAACLDLASLAPLPRACGGALLHYPQGAADAPLPRDVHRLLRYDADALRALNVRLRALLRCAQPTHRTARHPPPAHLAGAARAARVRAPGGRRVAGVSVSHEHVRVRVPQPGGGGAWRSLTATSSRCRPHDCVAFDFEYASSEGFSAPNAVDQPPAAQLAFEYTLILPVRAAVVRALLLCVRMLQNSRAIWRCMLSLRMQPTRRQATTAP